MTNRYDYKYFCNFYNRYKYKYKYIFDTDFLPLIDTVSAILYIYIYNIIKQVEWTQAYLFSSEKCYIINEVKESIRRKHHI